MFDIREHGGSFGGGKYRKNKYINYKNLEGVKLPLTLKYANGATYSTDVTRYISSLYKFTDGYYAIFGGIIASGGSYFSQYPAVYKLNDDFSLVSKTNLAISSSVGALQYITKVNDSDIIALCGSEIIKFNQNGTIIYHVAARGSVISSLTGNYSVRNILYSKHKNAWYKLFDGSLVEFDINTGLEISRIAINGNWSGTYNYGFLSVGGRYFWYSSGSGSYLTCLDLETLESKVFYFKSSEYAFGPDIYHNDQTGEIYMMRTSTYYQYIDYYNYETMFAGTSTATTPTTYISTFLLSGSVYGFSLDKVNGVESILCNTATYVYNIKKDLSEVIYKYSNSDFPGIFGAYFISKDISPIGYSPLGAFSRNIGINLQDAHENLTCYYSDASYISEIKFNTKILQ